MRADMRDPAFQWETEALRSSPSAHRHDTPRPRHATGGPQDEGRGHPQTGATPETPALPPPGTMIVPISAWEKMLIQLGNLHEAGREIAEAKERAARAETEVSFLRERLAELRKEPAEPSPTGDAGASTQWAVPGVVSGWWQRLRRRR